MSFDRVLVTGGAGFLGSHLCRRLLMEGHEVICMDNLFTSQKDNIRDFLGHKHFEFIRHDVTTPFEVQVDKIYHLACPASPVHYQYNPIKTIKTSFLGTMNALGLAKRLRIPILFTSTSEVYGDPTQCPQTETYWGNVNTVGIRSCYDEGKRAAETLCFDYMRHHQVDVKVVRIFNTYGPGMHPYDGRVITNFIMQALQGNDMTIYGDGTQTRSFCYVDDMVEGLIRMMRSTHHGPINLGNPHEITVAQLAAKIWTMAGSTSSLLQMPLPQDDPKRRCPCIQKAQTRLQWHPRISLEQGLQKTIEYFKHLHLNRYKSPT